jgi:tRNA nucleotidyltransferase (CCA-adding enzyme)
MIDTSQIPPSVRVLAQRIRQEGGSAMLVGGAVIDLIEGRAPKDWDLEVFRLGFEGLGRLFSDLNPKKVGQAFGIIKLSLPDGSEVDINVPSASNTAGVGGGEASLDPRMPLREAARRRDFTINAMAVDLLTGELHDPFGGSADLKAGVLRATDPDLFVQDPVRALRAMQLLARKARSIEPATMSLIRGLRGELALEPRERLFPEFEKLLLKADRPSVGLHFLVESGLIDLFPELDAMRGTDQHPEWHPEGDVWTHSCLAADAMAEIRHEIPEHQRTAFAFATFLHDIGKPEKTITPQMIASRDPRVTKAAESCGKDPEDMLWTAHGHDIAGMDPAETFLRRLTDSAKLIKLVRGIVGMHMRPWSLFAGNAGKGGFAKLAREMEGAGGDLRLIGRMCQCDSCATSATWGSRSLASGKPNWEHKSSERVFDWAEQFDGDRSAVTPKVQGRDLIAAGMKPGRHFGKILEEALELQFAEADLDKDAILARVLK